MITIEVETKEPTLEEILEGIKKAMSDFDVHMADERDREEARWLAKRPICSICEEHIVEDRCYKVDGELICEDCMNDMRVYTEDYEEE